MKKIFIVLLFVLLIMVIGCTQKVISYPTSQTKPDMFSIIESKMQSSKTIYCVQKKCVKYYQTIENERDILEEDNWNKTPKTIKWVESTIFHGEDSLYYYLYNKRPLKEGYLYYRFLKSEFATQEPTKNKLWVIPEKLNIRNGPGTEYMKVGTLVSRDFVFVTEEKNGWAKIISIGSNWDEPIPERWVSFKFLGSEWEANKAYAERQYKRTHSSIFYEVSTTEALPIVGYIYKLKRSNVALMFKPELPVNKEDFKRNLIVLFEYGDIIEVIDSKGILSPWYKVNLLRKYDGAILLRGWVLGEIIMNKITRVKVKK